MRSNESWVPAYIGLGSNLDDPRAQVRDAAAALATLPRSRLIIASALYRSAPHGPPDQPDFVNAVAALLSCLSPADLLSALQQLEDARGRQRSGPRWGPRRIDLDLLLFGDTVASGEALTLPHPRLAERAFVLCPLAEIAPGLRLPDGRLVRRLAQAIDCAQLDRIGELRTT